jgi:hypothetical protein
MSGLPDSGHDWAYEYTPSNVRSGLPRKRRALPRAAVSVVGV